MVQKMWIHLINSGVFNAHTLHKKKGEKLTPLEFRKKLVSQIEKYGEYENNRCRGKPSVAENQL